MRIYFRSTSRILRVAKTHAKITGLPLQAAQNEVAYMLGYADLHELQRISAEGVHEPSPDDQDIALEEELQRRAYQAERLEEYRRAPGRTRLDAMTARAIVRGDSSVAEISAASILAKTARDAHMLELHAQYPQYGFDRHKGYPTAGHVAALRLNGVSAVHRRSFAPVRNLLTAGN